MRYYFYPLGIALYALVVFLQKMRMMAAERAKIGSAV
jgi:hypothetical protein